MCLSEQNGLHWGAAKWYYEWVAGDGPDVPEAIVRHVRRCLSCRKQVDRWKEAVTGAGGETDRDRSAMKRDVIDTLSLHFGCLEERVTCARVKPFLPGLLLPSVQVRIPTPITVHIDHCPACADDLNTLRSLGLTAEQLERLERLYRGDSGGGSPADALRPALLAPRRRLREALRCRRARSGISAFVRGHLDDLDPETLDHLCTCPQCRPYVQHSRRRLLEDAPNGIAETPVACADEIPLAQLFDYAVPYGRTTDGQSRADESHVGTCHVCLREIQELDRTIYGIAERPDSGVATVYSTTEPDATSQSIVSMGNDTSSEDQVKGIDAGPVVNSFTDAYPDYPIRVQVMRGRPQPVVAAAQQRIVFDPHVRLLLKSAVAAAAMIPLAFLFLNTRTASGITLAQVFKAFGEAQNVHVIRSYPNTGQVLQEFWVSRTANRVLVRGGQERPLPDTEVHRIIDACLGFTPHDVPAGAQWRRLDSDALEGSEIYELSYTEPRRSGEVLLWKFEMMIDSSARLPGEVRIFRKTPPEKEWHYLARVECRYLTEGEMAPIIRPR